MLTNLQKYTIARVAGHSMWWLAIAPLYYIERGLTMEQVLVMVSIYSVMMVLAEYPTGIIADTFSHKKSVVVGILLTIVLFSLIIIPANFYFYTILFALTAISSAMRSGSDTAILHAISTDFKKDLAHINATVLAWNVVTVSIGAAAFSVNIMLPYILTVITLSISVIFMVSVKVEKKESATSGNIYQTTLAGITNIKKHQILQVTILLSGIFIAFFYTLKWLLPVLLESHNIDPAIMGTILSISILAMALSTKLSGTKYDVSLKYIIPILLLGSLALGFASSTIAIIAVMITIYFCRGFFSTHMTVLINKYSTDNIRASMLSLQSLVGRTFMAMYTLIAGKILGLWSFPWLSVFTFVILSIFASIFAITFIMNIQKDKSKRSMLR